MRPKYIILFAIPILTICFAITILLKHIDIREYSERQNRKYRPKGDLIQDKHSVIIDESNDNYFIFMQISDLHISSTSDNNRTSDLRYFCQEVVPLVAPDFVMVSGDITNAITLYRHDSTQIVEEWIAYEKVLKETKVLSKTKWLDLKGNHDQFNVPHPHHADNFFRQYSVQGKNNLQSYRYVNRKKFGTYSIIAMDAVPTPGLKRPYNFFGLITPSEVNLLKFFIRSSEKDNLTIWFGHYPTSSIISTKIDLRSLIGRSGLVYLTGHLHTFVGIYHHMFALQPQGYLELELSDWKRSRKFRICVVDHDIFSFTDVYLYDWPILLITNPKDSNFILPHKEAVYRIIDSTHIRMFAWSPAGISSVKVFINDKLLGAARPTPRSPLYTLPWSPSHYDPNKHHVMTVEVKDNADRVKIFIQNFNTAGLPSWQFFFYSSSVILMDMAYLMRFSYYSAWGILLGVFVILRSLRYKIDHLLLKIDCRIFHGLYRLVKYDPVFYSVIIYLLYCTWGPLMIGQIVERHWAIVFLHGIYVSNTYIPDGITYLLEFIQLIVFVIPTLLYFSYLLSIDHYSASIITDKWQLWKKHRVFVILLIIQTLYTLFTVFIPYGLVCTVFSPCRFWLIPGAGYLLHSLNHILFSTVVDSSTMTNRVSESSLSDSATNYNNIKSS